MQRYIKFTQQADVQRHLDQLNQKLGYPNKRTLTDTYATPENVKGEYLLTIEGKDYSRVEKQFNTAEKSAMVTRRPKGFETSREIL